MRIFISLLTVVALFFILRGRSYPAQITVCDVKSDKIVSCSGDTIRLIGVKEGAALTSLIGGRVELEYGKARHDKKGNLLCYVFRYGDFINEKLILEGRSKYSDGINSKYEWRLKSAQAEAIAKGKGLWK